MELPRIPLPESVERPGQSSKTFSYALPQMIAIQTRQKNGNLRTDVDVVFQPYDPDTGEVLQKPKKHLHLEDILKEAEEDEEVREAVESLVNVLAKKLGEQR